MLKAVQMLIGLALLAKGFHMLGGVAGTGGGHYQVFSAALFAFAVLILGALVLAPSLAAWAATPFTRLIDSIYQPGGSSGGKPEPNYRLAEYYYRSRQYDLAIGEYQKIVKYHPRQTRAYVALVDLWANHKKQPARAARLYRRGLRKIRKRVERRKLRDAYRGGDVVSMALDQPEAPPAPAAGRVRFPDLRGGKA